MIIDRFEDDYFFLSNFYVNPLEGVKFAGLRVASTEHAYQMTKATNEEDLSWVAAASTAGQAKKRGRRIFCRSDWDEIKIPVMRAVLASKFSWESELSNRLLDTEDALLVEGNYWHDIFWGVCHGKCRSGPHPSMGENWLGWCLMAQRAALRSRDALRYPPRSDFQFPDS